MSDIQYVSKEGLERMKQELYLMKHEERPSITIAIAEARDKGDLSENAEYDAAKEAQGILEYKISQMEHMVANARVLDTSNLDTSKVSIMLNVRVKNHNVGKEAVYRLVSESEANLRRIKFLSKVQLHKV